MPLLEGTCEDIPSARVVHDVLAMVLHSALDTGGVRLHTLGMRDTQQSNQLRVRHQSSAKQT